MPDLEDALNAEYDRERAFALHRPAGLRSPTAAQAHEPFRIDDDGKADWALRHIASHRAAIKADREIAEAQLALIHHWITEREEAHEREMAWFVRGLEDYARTQRAEADRKTISLPHGAIKTTARPASLEIDEPEFLAWAKVNAPDLVRTKEEPKVGDLRTWATIAQPDETSPVLTPEGEIIPGVTATPQDPSIKIET